MQEAKTDRKPHNQMLTFCASHVSLLMLVTCEHALHFGTFYVKCHGISFHDIKFVVSFFAR